MVFLNIAKLKGNTPAVFLLLDALGDYNQTDAEGKTLLHWASSRGKIPLINFLLEKGVDVNQKDKKGKTAVSLAKNEDIRKLLQESGKLSSDAAEARLQSLPCSFPGLSRPLPGDDVMPGSWP